jgi:hypothetical protein
MLEADYAPKMMPNSIELFFPDEGYENILDKLEFVTQIDGRHAKIAETLSPEITKQKSQVPKCDFCF